MCLLDSELMIVGALLGDGRNTKTIRSELCPDDFMTDEGRAVFCAACSLDDEGQNIDPVLISQRALEGGSRIETAYAINAMGVAASASNLWEHMAGMKRKRMWTRLVDVVSSAQVRLMAEESPQTVCTDLQGDLDAIAEADKARDLISSTDAVSRFLDHRAAIDSGTKRPFVPTGYNALDNALGGGMVPEGLYILAARPGCGKTTVGLQIADRVAAAGVPVLFVSLEMSDLQLTARRLAVESKIPATRILMNRLSDEEHAQIAKASYTIGKRPLVFNAARRASVGSIGVLARQVKDCGLVVIDYLGLLQHEHGKSLYEKVTATSNELKRMARTLGIPILCLAQLNREFEGRTGAPRLSDLRDSGAIEQDADGVLLLHRLATAEDWTGPIQLDCIIAKNRHGSMGKTIPFNWYLETGIIRPQMEQRYAGI